MKDKKILIGTALALLLLLTTGLSYAYFSTAVKGNDNAKDVVVEAGTLKLTYTDGPAINAQYIKPGWSTTKEVSVKNNGTLDTNYNIIWQSLTNGIINDELVLSATCQRLNSAGTVEGTCESISQSPIKDTTISKNISIESGITHKYTFTILFKETNANQNYNQGKEFNGVFGIEEYKDLSSESTYCTFDGELTQGVEYVNGQYTYRYMQEGDESDSTTNKWKNISETGWGVQLTNKKSTEPVTSGLCKYVNNKPIISMANMFTNSQTTAIDLSSFDTSNVNNMMTMFDNSKVEMLDLSSFDTSNVTDMHWMFANTQVLALDLSSFDTSKVTNMSCMFYNSQATLLNLSSFNTKNIEYIESIDSIFVNMNNLKTIYASNKFSLSFDDDKGIGDIFAGCTNLVGGSGTMFDEENASFIYAHIDGGEDNPGYFTDIADKK